MSNQRSVPARPVAALVVALLIAIGIAARPGASGRFAWTDDPPDTPRAQAQTQRPTPMPTPAQARGLDAYAKLPLAFTENRGQADARVRYYAQGARYAFYLTQDEVVMSFLDASATAGHTLALRFPGSRAARAIDGEAAVAGDVNYFRGQDPAGWRTAIPRFARVAYRELWPGVDLRLYEQDGTLKYELLVRAGARPADIRLAYAGAETLSIDDAGALLIATQLGTLRDSPPVSYQMIDGQRVPVESHYTLGTAGRAGRTDRAGTAGAADAAVANGAAAEFGIAIGAGYRPEHDLIIDPGVQYSTFLGGSSHELGAGIQVDAAGNAYIAGTTQSPDFPTTPGAFRRTGAPSNFSDVFVSKLNAAGTALVYSTFIGGSNFDFGRGLAIDAAGNAYITGQTKSSNFPTTGGAFDRTFNVDTCPRCGIDQYDAFVTKLNPSGSALVYSTFLGGFDIDDGLGIALDAANNAYVTGETGSQNFPTTAGAFDRTPNGAFDAFVTKLNAAGSALIYSTYLGGTAVEFGTHIATDANGNAYITGSTSSPAFPTTPGAFSTASGGGFDAFVTKLNAQGSGLVYSSYLGGQGADGGSGLVVDAAGSAYICGGSGSTDFPTTSGAFDQTPDGSEAFVAKLTPDGSALVYATMLGGSSGEAANALVLDAAGNAWLTGITNSTDFPVTTDAFAVTLHGVADAFISELSADGTSLLYSTYLGGQLSDGGDSIARDARGIYVAGHTYSLDFPTTAGAFDTVFNGDPTIFWGDAFVTKIAVDSDTSTPPSTPPVPGAPALLAPSNNDTPPQPITFDWNDVPGAASYTIQIGSSTAFTAPLVREQTVAISMYATSNLATTAQFWRVRGVNVAGVAGAWSAVRRFTPQSSPPPATLSTFETNPSTVVGGNGSTGTVVLTVGAPEGGALIGLSSSHPAIATVPATVIAPSNSFTGTFSFTTAPVSVSTVVTITASYNGATRTATVTVTPTVTSPPPPPTVTELTLSASSVVGGAGVQGTLLLSSAAPAGGAVVALSSSHAGIASVPASVTIPEGFRATSFTMSTSSVSATTGVTISATYLASVRTAALTVTASAPPPQTATLTVTATGRGGERVSSAPAGISVSTGSSGAAAFATGTSITLSVSNGRDAVWSGACFERRIEAEELHVHADRGVGRHGERAVASRHAARRRVPGSPAGNSAASNGAAPPIFLSLSVDSARFFLRARATPKRTLAPDTVL